MEKAYCYRFYPTAEQESLLHRTIGCVRLVFNRALATITEAWYDWQERVDYVQTSAMLMQWKKQDDLQLLNEVSCVPLQQGLRHLQTAFTNFFAGRAKYPNFKKKRSGGSAEFPKSRNPSRESWESLATGETKRGEKMSRKYHPEYQDQHQTHHTDQMLKLLKNTRQLEC